MTERRDQVPRLSYLWNKCSWNVNYCGGFLWPFLPFLPVCLLACLCLSVCPTIYVCLSVFLCLPFRLCLSACPTIYVCLSVQLSVQLSISGYLCLSACLSVHLPVCMSIYLSIWTSTEKNHKTVTELCDFSVHWFLIVLIMKQICNALDNLFLFAVHVFYFFLPGEKNCRVLLIS